MQQLVSPGTALTILAGVLISGFYIHYMWAALKKAVRTRDDADVGEDTYRRSFFGAVISVVVSAIAISVYGLGPFLLYLGPIAALLSPIAVTFCLREELVGS
ncbi:MAG TPA: hypothetical protein VK524_30175 [Polyangiaceae bacterium]|nr:hypothetical protein [Polyangiaceae bacterium]